MGILFEKLEQMSGENRFWFYQIVSLILSFLSPALVNPFGRKSKRWLDRVGPFYFRQVPLD